MKQDLHWNIRHGVSNPNDVYSVVGLELKFHMKWTRWNIEYPLAKLSNIFQVHHLKTKSHRYIFLYYIPTGLIVVTSWIFFLLPSTSYPARSSARKSLASLLIVVNSFANNVWIRFPECSLFQIWFTERLFWWPSSCCSSTSFLGLSTTLQTPTTDVRTH